MIAFEVHNLTVCYNKRPVLWSVDFAIESGISVSIIGPNGAGKSTLIKAALGLIPIENGQVFFYGEELDKKRQIISYVPQRADIDWDFPITVYDVVGMGRECFLPFYKKLSKVDHEIIQHSLEEVGLVDLKNRRIRELSGGQQQRVFLARALAQQSSLYFLDEPFAAVDVATEELLFDCFKKLNKEGKTVICVHHDLNSVVENFDYSILVNLNLIAYGKTSDVLNPDNLAKAYGGRLRLLSDLSEKIREVDAK